MGDSGGPEVLAVKLVSIFGKERNVDLYWKGIVGDIIKG